MYHLYFLRYKICGVKKCTTPTWNMGWCDTRAECEMTWADPPLLLLLGSSFPLHLRSYFFCLFVLVRMREWDTYDDDHDTPTSHTLHTFVGAWKWRLVIISLGQRRHTHRQTHSYGGKWSSDETVLSLHLHPWLWHTVWDRRYIG